MFKKSVLLLIAIFTLANTSPEIDQIRVVKAGTENVVSSIHLTTDETIRLCTQAHVVYELGEKWVDVSCKWEVSFHYKGVLPDNGNFIDIFSDEPVDDTLFVTMPDSSHRVAIPVWIEYANVIGNIGMDFLNDPGGSDYEDTVSIKVSIRNIDGLIPGEFCADSIVYTMSQESPGDTLSELIINGKNVRFGEKTKQCFFNGVDTIKIVVRGGGGIWMYSYKVRVRFGLHTGSTDDFFVSGKNPVYRKNRFSDNGNGIYYKNRILHFGKNITSQLSICVMNFSGEIVHKGRYLPKMNASNEYYLPLSLKSGFYIIKTSSNDGNNIFPCMIMK